LSIVVKCQCGKKFKTKDELAGRKVRCPGCREPLRIPGGRSEKGASPRGAKVSTKAAKAGPSAGGVDEEAALLKFEEVQQRKAVDAETEAAYREEQNKLIESYDQIAGRTTAKDKKKKKGELTEGGVKKVTIFTKMADAFGVIFGTLLMKYLMIVLLAGGAVVGSVYVVRAVTNYMSEETAPTAPKQVRIKKLYSEIGAAIEAGRLAEANTLLQKILEIDPSKENNNKYQFWCKRLAEEFAKR